MRVLIVSDSKVDGGLMAQHLVERGHTVEQATGTAAGIKQLDSSLCEVLILDWAVGTPSSVDLLHRLRSMEGPRHVYAIVVMSQPAPSTVFAAFAAGADDLLRRPYLREELVVRVAAIERIRRWAAKVLGQVEDLGAKVKRLRLGESADRAIGKDLGEMLQRRFEVRAASRATGDKFVAAEVPIALVEEGIECRLQIGIDAASLEAAATTLLDGEASPELVADMLRELANVAGGAFVSAVESDGILVTLGLPTSGAPDRGWGTATGTAQEFVLGVSGVAFELSIRIVMESRELRTLGPRDLRHGMVVARNICNGEGGVILRAGTRLTEASVSRLSTILRAGTTVLVLAG